MGLPEVFVQSEFIRVCQIRSTLSKLGIVRHLFCWIPYSPRRFLLKIHNFRQPFDLVRRGITYTTIFFE